MSFIYEKIVGRDKDKPPPIKWLFFIFEISVDTPFWKRYYRPILIKLLHQNGNVPKIFIGFDLAIPLSCPVPFPFTRTLMEQSWERHFLHFGNVPKMKLAADDWRIETETCQDGNLIEAVWIALRRGTDNQLLVP
ncbi:hypothetical protein BK138_26175 [Paenibacillus rhizosphaerae]|uniref:Uncharacterized protein n=1 Tax=Paenibacillus rhizosphaerae TaxID=297318 RepID=A0A1R1EFI2_9BACL|nr:hypothetical protein BK138_26175 [Paenibacillus rhizosphaerae]